MSESTEVKPQIHKEKYVLSEESAKNELEKMFDYYEIDIENMKDGDLKLIIEIGYDKMIEATRRGRLQIKLENGIQIIQTLKNGTTKITYREIDGNAKEAMAGKKQTDFNGRIYALMGSLSGLGEVAIKQLKGVDMSLMETLGAIFLSI